MQIFIANPYYTRMDLMFIERSRFLDNRSGLSLWAHSLLRVGDVSFEFDRVPLFEPARAMFDPSPNGSKSDSAI